MSKKKPVLDPSLGLLELIKQVLTGELELPEIDTLANMPFEVTEYQIPKDVEKIMLLYHYLDSEHQELHEEMRRLNCEKATDRHLLLHNWLLAMKYLMLAALDGYHIAEVS